MSDVKTMERTEVVIDGVTALLAQEQDIDDLKRRIEAAAGTTGTFVEFTVVGNRAMSVLITPTSSVSITVATVEFDERDSGDENFPFGGFYDTM
nr:hypothetical protein [uncultured Microbacterium sp.]